MSRKSVLENPVLHFSSHVYKVEPAHLSQAVEKWAQRIKRRLADTVEAIIATGQEFIAARNALSHGEFGQLARITG
jgi:hypothetical protein